jgi:putative phage-type endonuclease
MGAAKKLEYPQGSKEWRDWRRHHIGASDAAAVLGLNRWKKPSDVAEEKLHGAVLEPNAAMERGTVLEKYIRQAYERLRSIEVKPGACYVSWDWPICAASLDGEHDGTIIEIKTVNARSFRSGEWGEEMTDEIPDYYFIQVQHQLAVTGLDEARLVAFVAEAETMDVMVQMLKGGADPEMIIQSIIGIGLKEYCIKRDAELSFQILSECQSWWIRHITNGLPVPDYSLAVDSGKFRKASVPEAEILGQLKSAYAKMKSGEAEFEDLKERVKGMIAEDSGIECDLGRITWKKAKDSEPIEATDWHKAFSALASACPSVDVLPIIEQAKTIIKKPGSRRFVVPRAWGGEEG